LVPFVTTGTTPVTGGKKTSVVQSIGTPAAGFISLEDIQRRHNVFLRLGISHLAKSHGRAGQILHQEFHQEFGLQFEHVGVKGAIRKSMSFDRQVEMPRLVWVILLGLLEKLKKVEDGLIEILSLSDRIVEVNPVVILTNVVHHDAAETTSESAAVQYSMSTPVRFRWPHPSDGQAGGGTSLFYEANGLRQVNKAVAHFTVTTGRENKAR
jgi:hypothetical protein